MAQAEQEAAMEINSWSSVRELSIQHEGYHKVDQTRRQGKDFASVYQQEIQKTGLQFSKHAAMRMSERGMELTTELAGDLSAAVAKAREKGAKEVVVIGADSAFIVNVTHNTVVTTMNAREMKNNIFTNIDGAILI